MTYWTDILFYLAFLGQIGVISMYFPRRIEARMRRLLDDYPPSTYPKLYPRPVGYYRMGIVAYRIANRIVVVLGLLVLVALLFLVDHGSFAEDGYISEFWPMAYGLLQALPLIGLEVTEASQFSLMRKANPSRRRAAVLQRRSLFDYISPRLVAAVVACFGLAVFVDFYVHDFVVSLSHDTLQRSLWLFAGNLFFVLVGACSLYGKKLNPHQSADDRARLTKARLQSMAYVSIAMSAFFLSQALDDVYSMAFLDAALLSVYLQSIVALTLATMLRQQPLGELDFDVYRDNGATARQDQSKELSHGHHLA